MKFLNFGLLNIDFVYYVDYFVSAGETIGSFGMDKNVGGKGLNQSVAFAKAGVNIYHAGCVGSEGRFLKDYMDKVGVNTENVFVVNIPTGNAIIQVDKNGQNCILLFGGANQSITEKMIDSVLSKFDAGDMIILQNEINCVDFHIKRQKLTD